MKKGAIFFFMMIFCMILLSFNQSKASVISYNYIGTITGSGSDRLMSDFGVNIGDSFSGMFSVDTDYTYDAAHNYNSPLNSWTLILGSRTLNMGQLVWRWGGSSVNIWSIVPGSLGNFYVDDANLDIWRLSNELFPVAGVGNITDISSLLQLQGWEEPSRLGNRLTGSIDTLSVTTPVPEPSTMLLLGSGLAGLAGYGRRRFRK